MDKKKKSLKKIIVAADAAVTLLLIAGYYIFFSSMNKADERQYVYIDDDDNIDSVIVKMDALCTPQSMLGFKLLASVTSYADHVRSGRYDVGDGKGAFNVFRRIKNGMQAPVNLTIPNVRTVERLAGALSKKLMMDSVTVLTAENGLDGDFVFELPPEATGKNWKLVKTAAGTLRLLNQTGTVLVVR